VTVAAGHAARAAAARGVHGYGDRYPDHDAQRPPGPPVLEGQVRGAVDQAPPPDPVEAAVCGGPELGGAGRLDLGWGGDGDLLGVTGQLLVAPPV